MYRQSFYTKTVFFPLPLDYHLIIFFILASPFIKELLSYFIGCSLQASLQNFCRYSNTISRICFYFLKLRFILLSNWCLVTLCNLFFLGKESFPDWRVNASKKWKGQHPRTLLVNATDYYPDCTSNLDPDLVHRALV